MRLGLIKILRIAFENHKIIRESLQISWVSRKERSFRTSFFMRTHVKHFQNEKQRK